MEIRRPRLPWWVLLPWGAQLVIAPFLAVYLLACLIVRTGRVITRYPVAVVLAVATGWLWVAGARWWSLAPLGGLGLLLGAWVWALPVSFGRFPLAELRTEWQRLVVYAVAWREVMRLNELTKTHRGREYRPRLGRVRCDGWRDRVRVRLVLGQSHEHWELRASALAHSFTAEGVRVRRLKPSWLELDFIHTNPLATPVQLPALAEHNSVADLARLPIGRTETGRPWTLGLLGTHVLTVGVSGAGKGSVLWSLVWALAPAVRAGRVRLLGIDPKGGMELGQCPEVFEHVVFDNGPDAVALLETLATDVKHRATRYRGKRRTWSPETGDAFTVLVVDELADLLAYQPDRHLRERANRAVQTITSQGRAPGICVLGLLQDPRKEVLSFRHLFSTRIAMRLDEPQQVDMVLGDGVRHRGAAAHEIPETTPGVAWVKEENRRDPVRARAFHVTDSHLDELATYVTGRTVRRAQVLPFPHHNNTESGGAAA